MRDDEEYKAYLGRMWRISGKVGITDELVMALREDAAKFGKRLDKGMDKYFESESARAFWKPIMKEKTMRNRIYNFFDVCVTFGVCHYDNDHGIDFYIEPAKLFRGFYNYKYGHGERDIEFSVFRISFQ